MDCPGYYYLFVLFPRRLASSNFLSFALNLVWAIAGAAHCSTILAPVPNSQKSSPTHENAPENGRLLVDGVVSAMAAPNFSSLDL
jgi:hypothetical protein